MHKFFTACLTLSSLAVLSLPATTVDSPTGTQSIDYKTSDPKELKDLQDSAKASQKFLELIDSQEFGKSWNTASSFFKVTIDQDEWNTNMNNTRKPLGNLISREIGDQSTSKDPENLPKGDYMVMFYRSVFSNKPKAYELVTLFKEDGEWKVLTYQVN